MRFASQIKTVAAWEGLHRLTCRHRGHLPRWDAEEAGTDVVVGGDTEPILGVRSEAAMETHRLSDTSIRAAQRRGKSLGRIHRHLKYLTHSPGDSVGGPPMPDALPQGDISPTPPPSPLTHPVTV